MAKYCQMNNLIGRSICHDTCSTSFDRQKKLKLELDAEIAAAEACGKLHGVGKQFCIGDVIATGNLDIAEDSFYSQ